MRFRLAARARAFAGAVLACGVVAAAGAIAVAPQEVRACSGLLCPPTPSLPITLPTLSLPIGSSSPTASSGVCLPGTELIGGVCLPIPTPTPPTPTASVCVGPTCLPCIAPLCTPAPPTPTPTPTPTASTGTSTPTPGTPGDTPQATPIGGGSAAAGDGGGPFDGGRTAAGAGFGLRAGATQAVTKLDPLSGLRFGNGLVLAPIFAALDAMAVLVLLMVVRRSRRVAPGS